MLGLCRQDFKNFGSCYGNLGAGSKDTRHALLVQPCIVGMRDNPPHNHQNILSVECRQGCQRFRH